MTKKILLKHKHNSINFRKTLQPSKVLLIAKKRTIIICLFWIFGTSIHAQDFITTWETTTANEIITLPNSGMAAGYNFTVDWGDGTPIELNVNTPGKQHTYITPGTYTVRISGQFEEFDFTGTPTSPSANNLLFVNQWGNLAVSKLNFSGASRFQITATDNPDLTNVTSFDNLFSGASTVNADLSGWIVSGITSMNGTFRDAIAFNGDVSTWNTSEVTSMVDTFSGASAFDQNISGWNTAKVTDMSTMFFNALIFNQDISGWVTNEVLNMTGMFNGAARFNQNIGGWNTSKVTNLSFMFFRATAFNATIGSWNTSMVTDMTFMFASASTFNQDISGWITSEVRDMSSMFSGSLRFNQNIGGWDTTKVERMAFMFANARAFNQNISGWDTANVLSMSFMFNSAIAFNQSLANWNISKVTSLFNTLSNTGLSTLNYDATLIGWANQTIQSGLNLGANGLTYCLGETARNTLTNAPNLWVITDDGLDCSSLFITTWETNTTSEMITLPNDNGNGSLQYNFSIDWGDGTAIETNVTTPNMTHTYAIPGVYTVTIDGQFESFDFETVPNNTTNILSVEQWGNLLVSKLNFKDAINFQINDINAPDLSRVTSFDNLFNGATTVNADLSGWNVITIQSMNRTFLGATAFNGNISTWNTANVESMSSMFNNATTFNQDISSWDTSNVLKMDAMFDNAIVFNQNIRTSGTSWDTSKVDDMSFMFNNALVFNRDISNWSTNTVTDMSNMFNNAPEFNQNIGSWITDNVTDMSAIFNAATAFNQDLGGWNISKVASMSDALSNSGLSTQNYDATLIGWESQTVLTNVILGADGLTYCLAGNERNRLINNDLWTINGDRLGCSSILAFSISKTTDAIEGTSNATFTISIDGGIINTTGAPITGTLTLTGTATNGSDYTDITTFSIPNGDTNIIVTIPVIDDTEVEVLETIIATLSTTNTGNINATNNTATATITDDDSASLTISIGSPVDAIEGTSDATFTVNLDNGVSNNTGTSITGTLTLTGTATNGADYNNVSLFEIPNGSTSATITIPVINDNEIEPQETIIATISSPSLGTINTLNNFDTAFITDDDASALSYSITKTTDAIEGTSDASFTVSIDGGIINTTGMPITGIFTFSGTATNGVDYTNVTGFSIPNGSASVIVTIPIIDDLAVELPETIIAEISNPSIGNINSTNTTDTAIITDDDSTSLTISIGSPVDAIEGTSDATFIVSLDNGLRNETGSPIIGSITYSGTAINGIDYTNIMTFSIPDAASNVIVTIPVIDDTLVEPIETIISTISAPNIGAINIINTSAIANIIDDESTSLTISIESPIDAVEGFSDVNFTISLDNGVTNQTGSPITGTIVLTGTASNGVDYTNVVTFSIPDGSTTQTVVVPVIDDTEVEPLETIIATISFPNIGSINASSATASITDDDIPPNPNLALSKIGNYEDSNNDGVLNLGDQIVYTFTIENNGTETITNIRLTDPLPGIILNGESINLDSGEIDNSTFTAIYELTENDILTGSVINQAFVTGIDPLNMEIIDFSDDPNNDTNIDDDNDGDGEDPTITDLIIEDELIVYEIITPNGDGLNDELRISGLTKFPNNTIIIYNRWGAKVFEASGYEQKGVPLFNGIAKGEKKVLPTGSYFFTLQYQNTIGNSSSKSGFIHIN
ncbi:BspA family leucine-rich repeat surface protein [Aquimarina aggregata]|uniref:BspA family leucine-rich repeat surface protein n=1 Tax=Aquimarina aggregata TaxID=1642818 RepID=UPI002493565F|nr:BspA family leucine-rich repeat surface protein [Aquimarina aggregata]